MNNNLNLNEEDIEFLKELSYKRNNQETDGCCQPVFWMIYDKETIYCEDGEYLALYHDGDMIYSTEDEFNIDKLKEIKKYILDNIELTFFQKEDLNDINNNDDLMDYFIYNDLDITVSRFDKRYHILDTSGPFLTKEAAKKHIKENSHHYTKNVTTYGMVGWRNPEFEKLMEIISKIEGNK